MWCWLGSCRIPTLVFKFPIWLSWIKKLTFIKIQCGYLCLMFQYILHGCFKGNRNHLKSYIFFNFITSFWNFVILVFLGGIFNDSKFGSFGSLFKLTFGYNLQSCWFVFINHIEFSCWIKWNSCVYESYELAINYQDTLI